MADIQLAFVLLSEITDPDPAQVVAAAGALGMGLTYAPSDGDEVSQTYDIDGGGSLIVGLMPAPHPDAASMAHGVSSPSEEELASMVAHYIVTVFGREPATHPELELATLTAAIVNASPSIAAMLGPGVVFHTANFFTLAVVAADGDIPVEVTVDITVASEPANRMSFLTHGLEQYGREEFYVTAAINGEGALDYVRGLARWMVMDRDKHLPTGDTVGRTAEEKILVQRVPSPIEGNAAVIKLDLDMDHENPVVDLTEPPPKKKKKRGFGR